MRMHPLETLLLIHQEQAERRKRAGEQRLFARDERQPEAPPSDVVARLFGRPARSHPLRPWVTLDAEDGGAM
jgi:hypothetical protein